MAGYRKQTDKTHQITLPSSIERVQWTRLRAAPGGTAALEIYTRFVGSGAPLKIQLLDKRGCSYGTFSDETAGPRLRAEVTVPEKARDALVADVKLPKHGLQATSPALFLTPPVAVKNAAWSQDKAGRGDVLTLTADVKGAPDGTEAEVVILEYDDDGAHDRITRFPVLVDNGKVEAEWEFEYYEDTDDIPTEEEAEKGYQPPEYFFRAEVEGVSADSGLLRFKDWIEIEMHDPFQEPMSGCKYTLHLPDGSTRKGRLDDDGRAIEKNVPPGRCKAELPEI